jgi:hypothetical protein
VAQIQIPRPTSTVQLDARLRERRHPSTGSIGRRLTARVLEIPRGQFDPDSIARTPDEWLGLLVLDGLMAVGLESGRAQASWLVGGEDLVRPWSMHEPSSLIAEPSWRALKPTRLALLDGDFNRRIVGIPVIVGELVKRAAQTTHWLMAKSLVTASPVVEDRLLLLFALLSERWGRVRADGVWLDLPVTHELLAHMCGARRPSVTTALRGLRENGLVDCTRRGCWLLRHDVVARDWPSVARTRQWRGRGCASRLGSGVDGAVPEPLRRPAAVALDGDSDAMVA